MNVARVLALSTLVSVSMHGTSSQADPGPIFQIPLCLTAQTVSPGAAGTHPLASALATTCAGGTISVNPGTYLETLNITRSVTIKAAVTNSPPTIQNTITYPAQPALVSVSGNVNVTLSNLKLLPLAIRGVRGVATGAGAPNLTITSSQVTGGTQGVAGSFHKLSISGSAFAMATGDCVHASSDGLAGSSVNIANSSAGNCGKQGIWSADFPIASFTYNTVSWANGGAGISSANVATTVAHNKVDHSDQGIFVMAATHGVIDDNDVAFSTYADLVVWESDDVSVTDNRLVHGKGTGIYIEDSAGSSLDGNTVTGAVGPGIFITASADTAMAYNLVHGGLPGVYVQDSQHVSMDGDVVTGVKRAGIELHGVLDFSAEYVDVAAVGRDTDDNFGDGVLIDHVDVATFTDCHVDHVARAGFSAFNTVPGPPVLTSVVLADISVACAPVLFGAEPGAEYAQTNVTCRTCSDALMQCEVVSKNLQAPPALPKLVSNG